MCVTVVSVRVRASLRSVALLAAVGVTAAVAGAGATPTEHVALKVERTFDPAYGGYKLRFTGVIPNGAANEYVAILHQRCGDGFSGAAAGASTREGGFYEAIPEYGSPPASGTFRARWKGHLSRPVTFRPPARVLVAKLRARRYYVLVVAESNLSGRFVALQQLVVGRWTHVRRARLTASAQADSSTSYTATFTIRTRGLRLRVLVPKKTAAPCHLPAASRTFVS
jgi:hypothetical protein